MKKDQKALARMFENPQAQVEEMSEALRRVYPEDLCQILLDSAVPYLANKALCTAYASMNSRVKDVNSTLDRLEKIQSRDNPDRGAVRANTNEFFQLIDPSTLSAQLRHTVDVSLLVSDYTDTIARIADSCPAPGLVERYRFPGEIVRALATHASSPLEQAFRSLKSHAETLQQIGEAAKKAKQSQGLKAGLGIAASVVGGLLFGRAGSMGGRALVKEVAGSTAQVNPVARACSSFESYRASYFEVLCEIEKNLNLVVMVLYVGMLLRLQEDLEALGRQLTWVDLQDGTLLFDLSLREQLDFQRWGNRTLEGLKELEKAEDWIGLAEAADRALGHACSDALLMQVCPDESEISYSVLFAQFRAIAICRPADRLWSAGRYVEATNLYRHLFQGSFVAWENQDSPHYSDDAKGDLAAWRIALVTEHTRGIDPDLRHQLLGCAARWVRAAIGRFESDNPYSAAPGETVGGITGTVAAMLHLYLGGRPGDEPAGADGAALPSASPGWKSYFRRTIPVGTLHAVLGSAPDLLGGAANPFCGWLESKHRRDVRTRALKWIGILAILAALVGAGIRYGPDLAAVFEAEPEKPVTVAEIATDPEPEKVAEPSPSPAPPPEVSISKPAIVQELEAAPEPEEEPAPEPQRPPTGEIQIAVARIRAGTGTDTDIVGRMAKGTRFQVIERTGRWLRITQIDGAVEGWVREDLVSLDGPEPGIEDDVAEVRRMIITVDSAIFRKGPGRNFGRAGDSLPRGLTVQYIGETGGWIQVLTEEGVEGWVSGKLLSPSR